GRLGQGVLIGIVVTGQLIFYPEVFPFLVLAFALYVVSGLWRRQLAWKPMLASVGIGVLTSVILLNRAVLSPLLCMIEQSQAHQVHTERLVGIFPYYLLPTGLANLWGFLPLAGGWHGGFSRLLSVQIVTGGLLLAVVAYAAVRLARDLQPVAFMTVVMLAVAAVLLARREAFGLFKLAMFAQSFLLGTVVVAWFSLVRRPALRLTPLLLLGLASLSTQQVYVKASYGRMPMFVEIRDASSRDILSDFRNQLSGEPHRRVLIDSYNSSLVKLQLSQLRGVETTTPGVSFFQNYDVAGFNAKKALPIFHPMRFLSPSLRQATLALMAAVRGVCGDIRFDLHDPAHPAARNQARTVGLGAPRPGQADYDLLVACTPKTTILNRSHFSTRDDRLSVVRPWREVANHLVFVPSKLGYHPFDLAASAKDIALHSLEPDFFNKGGTMVGCGRHILFEVLRPTPGARLVLSLTESVRSDGICRLPPASVIGTQRLPLDMTGRGSSRVCSPPLTPQTIDGHYYLAIDLGAEGARIPIPRLGLLGLWGKDVPLDPRCLVGYLRDVSLLSQEDYE
ncbi:MAG: hypothetical protein ACRELG_18960, partial [Gemmataceae bacterium]